MLKQIKLQKSALDRTALIFRAVSLFRLLDYQGRVWGCSGFKLLGRISRACFLGSGFCAGTSESEVVYG